MQGFLSRRDVRRVQDALHDTVSSAPPRIGVVGVSGTGKSSTINAMFKADLAISHTRACTKQFEATSMRLRMNSGVAEGESVPLVVVDAPGLGEDVRLDPIYLDEYHRQLPACDVVLWVMTARNRALSLDQQYLTQLFDVGRRAVFAINQVDLVHPMDWDGRTNLPSAVMEANIAEIVADRTEKLATVLGRTPVVVPYSAQHGFNLETLFAELISALPESRRFIYDGLKNFSYRDFVPAEYQHLLPKGE